MAQVVDLGKHDRLEQVRFQRPAPAEPMCFYSGHRNGSKVYTNGADRDRIVAPKFRETIFELLGGVRELTFARLGWEDTEAERLARVLPLCINLNTINLLHNRIGDRGLKALATALGRPGSLPSLTSLVISFNPYTEAGLKALAKALKGDLDP